MKHATTTEPPKTELCKLFYKYLSDKCPQIYHTYSESYHDILSPMRLKAKNILEIGIGTPELMTEIAGDEYKVGASLYAWRDYFYTANIHAIDIDKTVLFEDDRIKTYYADQSSAFSLLNAVTAIGTTLDFIIDDGSHILDHQILTLRTLLPYLTVDGIYIVEDVQRKSLNHLIATIPKGYKMFHLHLGIDTLAGDTFIAIKRIHE
jgi:hypothetical protein